MDASKGEGVGGLNQVVQIDEGRIQQHLDEVVHSTVEETLNGLLDAEADRFGGVRRYEHNAEREDKGRRCDHVIGKDGPPVAIAFIAGQNDRAFLISLADQSQLNKRQ